MFLFKRVTVLTIHFQLCVLLVRNANRQFGHIRRPAHYYWQVKNLPKFLRSNYSQTFANCKNAGTDQRQAICASLRQPAPAILWVC